MNPSPLSSIRPATTGDFDRIAAIAAEGDSSDSNARYLSYVADHGRLLVAVLDEGVGAFGGMVPVSMGDSGDTPVAMVTDLFVTVGHRGRGLGEALLDELLDGHPRRMTASSKHPAAVPAYRRAGMQPRWNLLYVEGTAAGGGPPLRPGTWQHDRAELVAHFADDGAIVTADAVVMVGADGVDVLRVHSDDAARVMSELSTAFPAGVPIRACVPEPHPLARWMQARGFDVVDHDVFCTSDGIEFSPAVSCVHAGLA